MPFANQILILDDERPVAKAMQRALRRIGFYSEISDNSDQIEYLLDAHTPDILLLDLTMLGKNGFEVIALVRSKKKWRNIKILVVSALPRDFLNAALKFGADDVLEKPFENADLLEKVSQMASAKSRSDLHRKPLFEHQ